MRNSKHLRRIAVTTLAAFLLVVGCVAVAFATDKPAIVFAPGANSASVKGEIQGMDRDIYPITAKAGQTLQVSVKNKLKLVLFRLQLPGSEEKYLPKAGEEDDATEWKGKLPVSGTYAIVVGAMRGKDTKYSLDVQIID